MVDKRILCVLAVVIAACSSIEEKDTEPTPTPIASAKVAVTQVGFGQNADHVFCVEGKCPERTTKRIPAKRSEPADMKPSVEKQVPALKADPQRYKVHFRWGWSSLDDQGKRELQAVLDTGALKKATEVVVAGRTDPTGSKAANKRLAAKRADTVKAALVKAGVPADIIRAVSQKPCCDGDMHAADSVMHELRRTDIEITIATK